MSASVDELVDRLLAEVPPSTTPAQAFLGQQFDRGLAWLQYPTDCGGLGLTPNDQQRARSRLAAGRSSGPWIEEPDRVRHVRPDHCRPRQNKAFLRVRANSIEGGASGVMRSILGERVLGLPGAVRNDKELAWKDVPGSQ